MTLGIPLFIAGLSAVVLISHRLDASVPLLSILILCTPIKRNFVNFLQLNPKFLFSKFKIYLHLPLLASLKRPNSSPGANVSDTLVCLLPGL